MPCKIIILEPNFLLRSFSTSWIEAHRDLYTTKYRRDNIGWKVLRMEVTKCPPSAQKTLNLASMDNLTWRSTTPLCSFGIKCTSTPHMTKWIGSLMSVVCHYFLSGYFINSFGFIWIDIRKVLCAVLPFHILFHWSSLSCTSHLQGAIYWIQINITV